MRSAPRTHRRRAAAVRRSSAPNGGQERRGFGAPPVTRASSLLKRLVPVTDRRAAHSPLGHGSSTAGAGVGSNCMMPILICHRTSVSSSRGPRRPDRARWSWSKQTSTTRSTGSTGTAAGSITSCCTLCSGCALIGNHQCSTRRCPRHPVPRRYVVNRRLRQFIPCSMSEECDMSDQTSDRDFWERRGHRRCVNTPMRSPVGRPASTSSVRSGASSVGWPSTPGASMAPRRSGWRRPGRGRPRGLDPSPAPLRSRQLSLRP